MSDPADIKRPIGVIWSIALLGLLTGCGKPPPPPSVAELLADPVLLEATMVRCLEQHSGTNYAAECIAAREAAGQLAVAAENARRQELEAQSERKREARRRAQEAADAARRQALQLAEERRAAEYLGLLPAEPAGAETMPADTGELNFITIGEAPTAGEAGSLAVGGERVPQVTVQELDLGAMLPAAPPEPEPEAE